ncbi:hypothetical protein BofuT4_P097430.1 [Botrytis cinerea T4]|uniref:Uncharacterized protein n=1 Tax=Botryotinia fuckeliana (strain T4) TaxID=999810 RepID=G2YCY7_BOTF4|nr:hypothetical protein BofuT4_P097430.1 [Botrytis cinerea T4]
MAFKRCPARSNRRDGRQAYNMMLLHYPLHYAAHCNANASA